MNLRDDPCFEQARRQLIHKMLSVRHRLDDPLMPGIGGLLEDLQAACSKFNQALDAVIVDAAAKLKAKRCTVDEFERSADDYNDQRLRAREARRLEDEENR